MWSLEGHRGSQTPAFRSRGQGAGSGSETRSPADWVIFLIKFCNNHKWVTLSAPGCLQHERKVIYESAETDSGWHAL